jgi:glycosyltransferase involved in cell wall biosynthesis
VGVIGNALAKVNLNIWTIFKGLLSSLQKGGMVIQLNPYKDANPRGCVVISYLTWPLEEGIAPERMRGHTNASEVITMAEAFRELGFRVEVCSWDDAFYTPPEDTRIAIDIHSNLERWTLPKDCIKVLHATGALWSFQNNAESMRLDGVRKRRGVGLMPRRTAAPSRGGEIADHIVVLGNEFTEETFRFAGKPITRVPISSTYRFPFPENRNYKKALKRFLWVGSFGMVHKGLDLVLEAFAGMPDLELTVCGRPEKEDDFFRLYKKELKQTPNIHFHGWVDMASPEFNQISLTHASVVYPSCSEGGGGSVIHCMHAGMIPVCTREASVDLNDFGVLITEGSVSAVQEAVRKVASMSASEVEQRARGSWLHVRAVHTKEQFSQNYAAFASSLTS